MQKRSRANIVVTRSGSICEYDFEIGVIRRGDKYETCQEEPPSNLSAAVLSAITPDLGQRDAQNLLTSVTTNTPHRLVAELSGVFRGYYEANVPSPFLDVDRPAA